MPDQQTIAALRKGILALALFVYGIAFAPATAQACSIITKSTYDYYNAASKVFVGTVEEGPDQKGSYKVRVNEAFKGFDDKNEYNGLTELVFDTGMCGFDKQEKGAKLLFFIKDGEKVSRSGGTIPIWQVEDQTKAETNLYRVVTLRQMLEPSNKGIPKGAVPDEEAAIYMAYRAAIPVYGKEVVSKGAPYKARLIREKPEGSEYEEDMWLVSPSACEQPEQSCKSAAPQVKIGRWSGKVLKVYSTGG